VVLLEKVELNDIVLHCLGIPHKSDGQVGLDSKDQQATSYLQVLPRTMSMALQANWKQVVQEYDKVNQCGNPGSPKNKISVRPEDLCPIHPVASHTRSKCYSNAAHHNNVKNSVATNKVHKKKEKVQEANVSNIALVTECIISNNNSFISDSKLMAEICCFEQLDTDLMDATAIDLTVTGMSVFNESITHQLNELTFDAFQHRVTTNILSTEFIDVFTRYCDDSYSSGVSDVNLKDFSEIMLELRSTSLAIVGIIQQNKTNALWKVLFDSRSDKTIIKRTS
jgi:hypothetical protein